MVMSNETSTRAQKREKSVTGGGGGKPTTHKIPQATAEQMRIAQLVSDQKDDEILLSNVSQIIEVTGTSEENALMALYDSSNDPSRAIELILEKGTLIKDDGWETAGRKKNRGGSSMTRGIDTFEDEPKEEKTNESKRDWNETGRGRGSRRGKGRNQDRSRTHDDNDKENENLQDRGKDGRRGGGRGRGRSGPSRGRGGRGRGAPRHSKFNSNFGGKYGEDSSSYNSKDTLTEPVDMWKGATTECWDIEVGTWSSEDAKKQQTKKEKPDNAFTDNWGTESWNDDLSESKVFQAQNIPLPVQSLSGENADRGGGNMNIQSSAGDMQPISNHYQNSTPQTGERIDLGMLFKKSGNSSLRNSDNASGYGNAGNIGYGTSTQSHSMQQHTTPDVIQQLQQHGQSNSLFSESSASATSVTSRLFSEYDRPQHQPQSTQDSLFKTSTDAQSGVESSYSQLNGTVGQLNNQSKNSSSSFLDSFSGLSSNTAHQSQSAMLGQLADLSSKQTSMSSYSQVRQQPDGPVGNRGLNSFSQGQQKQATDAVKASLGIPIGESTSGLQQHSSHGNTQVQSGQMSLQSQLKDEAHLSFGSPLPPQMHQQSKQQRKKIPSMQSKIPASAVEMPGNNSYNTQEYVNFSLQFGADDSAPPMEPNLSSADYGVAMTHSGTANIIAQRSLFLNNDVPAEQSSSNRLSSNVTDSSLFTQASPQMTPTKSEMQRSQENVMLPTQRIGEAVTSSLDQPSRAPPGLSIPNPESSALSSLAGGGSGGHVGGSRLGPDISSLYKGSNEHDMNSGRSLETSLGQVQSLSSNFPQVHHSYYSSTSSSGNQSQQQDISSSVGRNLHTPDASSSLPGSLQSSPMPQSKLMQRSGNTPVKDPSSNMEPSSTPHSISSLATSLSQVSMPSGAQHHHHGTGTSVLNQSSMLSAALTTSSAPLPYSSTLSSSGNRGMPDQNTTSSIGKGGYDASQDSMASFNSYTSTPSNVAAVSTMQSQQSGHSQTQSTITTNAGMHGSAFSSQSSSTLSSTTLGGFATAKMPHPMSNKAPLNIPPGVTTPILQSQYGIPMAGLMPYAPDMSYGYDQLLLAQSRVINPLSYYDMHFHNNTHNATVNGRDSNATLGQPSTGQGKYNREPSSPTPSAAQLPLSGSMGSNMSQHNSSVSQQNTQMKAGSQSAGHHSAQQQQQQQFVGAALPAAYAGYSSLAGPYYGGMPGFQYPPTMFAAAAMHQAPKHSVNATTGFQQPSTGFNHSYSSASITSSSGLQDLQGSNYSKTHASAFEKQQGYHQHANTPPPFNIQAINAAVAAGGGATTGGGAPGLGPYTTPYMAMLQPHQSQQQAIHLLQQQHQDATGGQPIGSQRNLGSNSLVKSVNKQSAYGASGYWGN